MTSRGRLVPGKRQAFLAGLALTAALVASARSVSAEGVCIAGSVSIADQSTPPPDSFISVMPVGLPEDPSLNNYSLPGIGDCWVGGWANLPMPGTSSEVCLFAFVDTAYHSVAANWIFWGLMLAETPGSHPPYYGAIVQGASCGPSGLDMLNPEESANYHCEGEFNVPAVAQLGSAHGRVSYADGSPAVGVTVGAYWDLGPDGSFLLATATTNENAEYNFTPEGEPNNWALVVDPVSTGGLGQRPYVLVAGGTDGEVPPADAPDGKPVVIESSKLAEQDLTAPGDSSDPDLRGCPRVGKPVSVVSGNAFLDQVDVDLPGLMPVRFARSYNSKNAGGGGVLGPGWTHTYEARVTRLTPTRIMLRGGDGVGQVFKDDGTGAYRPWIPFNRESWIVAEGVGFTRYFRKGGRETYDAQGRIVATRDRVGNAVIITRDGPRVTVVTGSRQLSFGYNASGQLVSLEGPNGLIATYAYAGKLLHSVTYLDGSGYTFAYDGQNQLTRVTDASGTIVESHTYSLGRALTSEIADGQEKFTFAYAPHETTVTDAVGNAATYQSDVFGGLAKVTQVTGPCNCGGGPGETHSWTYDDRGLVLTDTNGVGATTTYTYDANGDLLTKTDALNRQTTYTYDTLGQVLSRQDPDGGLVSYTYGAAGPLTLTQSISPTLSRTTSIGYSDQGQPTTITDPRGKTTALGYSFTTGDLTSVTDPLGNPTNLTYDSMGRRTSVADGLGNTSTLAYDVQGRLTSVTRPDASHTEFTYDLGGRRTSMVDPLARTTLYGHDAYGRLETVADPLNGLTRYAHDARSNVTSLTDARGKVTSFDYDAYSRVKTVTYPGGATERYTYDAAGRQGTRTDRKGVITTYAHDAVGRLMSKAYSDGSPPVALTYDPVGRLLTAANAADSLAWTYDLAGQVLSEASSANTSTVSYSYDESGNRLKLKLNGDLVLKYAYDDADRLEKITRDDTHFRFEYDAASRRTKLVFPNGTRALYDYDVNSQLTKVVTKLDTVELTKSTYNYDAAGNRTKKAGDFEEVYTYDGLDRLTKAKRDGIVTEKYTYDAVGNRLSALGSSPWVIDDQNRLLSYPGVTFQYDANGNTATKVDTTGAWAHEWDVENRLTRVLKDGSEVALYAYDALGRRVRKVAGATTTAYLYDGEDILRDAVNGSLTLYLHGPGIDEPLAREDAAGNRTYYHADGLGSLIRETDSIGTVTFTRKYDAFGYLQSGGLTAGYAFTGREWDPETELYYYRARYYDPKLGRFLSEDPIGFSGGVNFYGYVGGNPVNFLDPFGWERVIVGTIPGPNGMPVPIYADSDDRGNASVGSPTPNGSSGTSEILGQELARAYVEMALSEVAGAAVGKVISFCSGKVARLAERLAEWLGPDFRVITNKNGDKIFVSADEARRFRVDISNPAPHANPHTHLEYKDANGKLVKSGPIYPTDVPHQ